ncbi:hypothetical protein [Rhizobium sp. WYJ-E13]|uniref:hypothetical protein n=1 Tax=Rhizobium sp. WYJ-E13 TaxID=2849093 RepID=UPI001C1EDA74|nr:hypothetical protein [Rhizobium sp. WYJ-E13]QWW71698.1 hypothetical protein KQ933_24060 [Rhizobium sp. WYJ-E13]
MEADVADNETLLGISSVYLFGRPLNDLLLRGSVYGPQIAPEVGKNNFLRSQLAAEGANLARIYAFSFEGAFVELGRPAIFVVHGAGADPDDPAPNDIGYERLSRSPGSSARTGLGSQIGALSKDMRVWTYDKGDFSMRLDVETGTFEQILLSTEASTDLRGGMSRSGGALSRSGGVMSRSGGFVPRRSGDND